jgi:hypothetical protein
LGRSSGRGVKSTTQMFRLANWVPTHGTLGGSFNVITVCRIYYCYGTSESFIFHVST